MSVLTLLFVGFLFFAFLGFILDALGGIVKLVGAIVVFYFILKFFGIIV